MIEGFGQPSGAGERDHLAQSRVCGMEALRMLSGPVVYDGVRLSDVFLAAEHRGTHALRVSGCCADSRRCRPGDLFVAIRGSRVDGHAFIAEAVQRGATAVICEQLPADVSVPTCVVPDSRAAIRSALSGTGRQPERRLERDRSNRNQRKDDDELSDRRSARRGGHRCGRAGNARLF